jgi:hypothetical protein
MWESDWFVNNDIAMKACRKAKVFVDWLKTADEEDDDEENEKSF